MLLFQIADEPWAIAATEVKDLIPLATLQPYSGSDSSNGTQIAGLLNYHGEHLPVIYVAHRIARQRTPFALSTRIAIVEAQSTARKTASQPDGNIAVPLAGITADPAEDGGAAFKKRGLILGRAYETAYLSKTVDLPVSSPYVNATLAGPEGIVQQLATASFF